MHLDFEFFNHFYLQILCMYLKILNVFQIFHLLFNFIVCLHIFVIFLHFAIAKSLEKRLCVCVCVLQVCEWKRWNSCKKFKRHCSVFFWQHFWMLDNVFEKWIEIFLRAIEANKAKIIKEITNNTRKQTKHIFKAEKFNIYWYCQQQKQHVCYFFFLFFFAVFLSLY